MGTTYDCCHAVFPTRSVERVSVPVARSGKNNSSIPLSVLVESEERNAMPYHAVRDELYIKCSFRLHKLVIHICLLITAIASLLWHLHILLFNSILGRW